MRRALAGSTIPLLLISVILLWLAGSHGANAAALGGSADEHALSPGIAYLLTGLAATLGALSVAGGLTALRLGWSFPAVSLLLLGVLSSGLLATSLPVGSADIGSYASYGAMERGGLDSYATTPAHHLRISDDAAEDPWRDTPNVYGPVATHIFERATHGSEITDEAGKPSGEIDPFTTDRHLQHFAWLAFVLTGLLLLLIARTRAGRARSQLLWTCNPLLQLHLVSAGHVDVYVAFFVVLSVALARMPLLRGASAALAVATKATAGWAALGLVIGKPRRGRFRRLVAFLAIAITLYATASSHVLDQAHKASRYVSAGTPWRWVASFLEWFLPHDLARWLVAAAAIGVTIGLAMAITVTFSYWPEKGTPERAARSALIPMLAWTLAAPYQLPWYDAVVWSLLACSVAMGLDWLILVHTTVLTLAYLPGRVVPLGDVPHAIQTVLRSGVSPVVVGLCAALCVWTLKRSDQQSEGAGRG